MKNILLITSHYPPSNLTGTHRARLFAKHLPLFGWNPIVLTVDQMFYEENPDNELNQLIPVGQRIERVSAFRLTKPRIIGDLGLRAFFQLKKKAFEIMEKEKIEFVYIFIPSFYLSLLGPIIFNRFGIKYGIDYIDPWVHKFPGSEKKFSRHWWSTFLAKYLEPFAIKHVSLITGVSEKYYSPVLKRNPSLSNRVITASLPYGWDKEDGRIGVISSSSNLIFNKNNKIKLVYPGAFLPESHQFIERFFYVISTNRALFSEIEIYFIGTGRKISSNMSSTIKSLAEKYGLYDQVIFEYPNRLTYLTTLYHISSASGLFILGSSEEHYTPSKLFNAFITQRPIFAILHESSTGKKIIESSGWGKVATFSPKITPENFDEDILRQFRSWLDCTRQNLWECDSIVAEQYSITQITSELNNSLNAAL